MPGLSNPYLALVSTALGAVTCTVADGAGGQTNFPMEMNNYAPAVAGLSRSVLGGRFPYNAALEDWMLDIIGTTEDDCYAQLNKLTNLLDQAERWWRGETVGAVLYKYVPKGSVVGTLANPFQAVVYGRPENERASAVALPRKWPGAGLYYVIQGVRVRFLRAGQLLQNQGSQFSALTVANGALGTVNFGAAQEIVGPTRVDVENYPASASDQGFLLVSSNDSSTRIGLANPTTGTAANWTAPNDAANFAQYTNVLRYTPVATTESQSGTFTTPSINSETQVGIYANIRNNSNTVSYYLRSQIFDSLARSSVYTPDVFIPPYTALGPSWFFLGIASVMFVPSTMRFLATASATGNTLDIGAVAMIDLGYAGSTVLAYKPTETNAVIKILSINPNALSKPAPGTSTSYPFDVTGDMMVMTKDQNVVLANLICSTSANDWRQTSGGAVVNNNFTLARHPAYLAPR